MRLLFSVLALIGTIPSFCQTISGLITDSVNAPIPFVAVGLLRSQDSLIQKGTLTDESGNFTFENASKGSYILKAEAFGFEPFFSQVFTYDSLQQLKAGKMVLAPHPQTLAEVSVSAIKKLVEFKNGNITVNIDGSPLATGNSLYDLLSRLPTVTIIDDVISIQGKDGARILIDERLQQISGQPLINLLKSIQASTVDKIEILKNPPARYDAAGAGFISVKTKKIRITGFSGSANVSYQQGMYAGQDAGISLNYKGRSFAVFSSLNSGRNEFLYTSHFVKTITYNDITTVFDQKTKEFNFNAYLSGNIGADLYLNKKNTLGFRIDGGTGEGQPDRNGVNDLSDGTLGYNQLRFSSVRPYAWSNINYNINYEHVFDTLGTLLRYSGDITRNKDLNAGRFENYFVDSSSAYALPPKIFKSDNNLNFIIYSSRLDFERNLNKKLKFEAGLKGTDQRMRTDFNFYNRDASTGDYALDTVFTNGFSYDEKVYAGYVNGIANLGKINFQLGLRSEQTIVDAVSLTKSVSYKRRYLNLFPTLSLDYNPSKKHGWQLSYNRRINRPGYSMFNPYKYFVNLFVSFYGNPYLVPEYHHNVEVSHGFQSALYNSLSYTRVNNLFFGLPMQNDSSKETSHTTANFRMGQLLAYNLFFQGELKKWWMINLNGMIGYGTFDGEVEGRRVSGSTMQSNAFINNQFSLRKNYKLEVQAFYYGPNQMVLTRIRGRWSMGLSLRKSFFDNRLAATIGVNDVFFTWVMVNEVQYENINSSVLSTWDTRRFRINLSYNFGKVRVQQRQIKGNQEEKSRLERK